MRGGFEPENRTRLAILRGYAARPTDPPLECNDITKLNHSLAKSPNPLLGSI